MKKSGHPFEYGKNGFRRRPAADVAAYQAGAIVPVPATAGAKHGRQETQEIARQALELAAAKRSRAAPSAQAAQEQASQEEEEAATAERRPAAAPAADKDEDLTSEDEQEGPNDEAPKSNPGKAAAGAGAVSWLTVSDAREVTVTEISDALVLVGLELTDDTREGGALALHTKALAICSDTPTGPHHFKYQGKDTASIILGEWGRVLVVDKTDGEEVACRLSVRTTLRDAGAYTMAAAAGFWGEIFTSKEIVVTRAQGEILLSNQLGVMVTRCKWPRSKPGEPPKRHKMVFQAMPDPSAPATSNLPAVAPQRWR